jgi:hypothetical protein
MNAARFLPMVLAAATALSWPRELAAQDTTGGQRTRPAHRAISIGNYPRVDGVRLNFRDRQLDRVRGANITVWNPYEPATGRVTGLALGLPMTGAGSIHGLGVGVIGVSATGLLKGIAVGGIGAGSGGGVQGLAIGGVGVGSGGDITGVAIGGIGAGGGGKAKGLLLGGVGVGSGGDVEGIAIGGVGVGSGGHVRGLMIGGVGVGAGASFSGIAIAGVGTGSGGDVTGLTISGVGAGAGGTMRGIGIAGVGIGAQRLVGGFVAPLIGAQDAHAYVLAPITFKIAKGGSFRGASLSAVNDVRGSQRGLTIGIVNYARTLSGVQIGVINIISNAPSHRVLPVVNWGR